MANKTLTVNGQPFVINRDKKADVSQLTVNGQAFSINRTAPVIDSDRKGESRPLLGKLVGGAACAYSLRDLNSKQGDTDVVKVRRSETNDEKIFKAKDVDKIEDWVTGKQEDTLPANIKSVTSFTLSGLTTNTEGNGLYTLNSDGEYVNGSYKFYKLSTTWTWTGNNDNPVVASGTAADYPWLTNWSDTVYGVGTNDLVNANFELHYTETNDAAFSLRKVNKDYTGKALRVRRSSDDTEVDVAFDGEGKVSNQSRITNVIEEGGELRDTTFTTLGEFLKEEHEVTSSSLFSNKINASVQGTVNEATNKVIDFTVNTLQKSTGASTTNMWLMKLENHNQPSIGKIRISLDCTHFDFENGGSLFVQPLYDHDGDGNNSYANALTITGTGHYTTEIDLATRQTHAAFRIFRGGVAVGDRVRIENLKIESLTSGASVHTWYNQSGAANASEDTDANQPWVAEFGNVIDGVRFDGNRFLNIPDNIMDTSDASLSMVVSGINTGQETHFLSNRNNTGGQSGYSISNKLSGSQGKLFYGFIGTGNQSTTNVVIQNNSNTKQLFTLTKDKNDRELFGNGVQLADNASSDTYNSPSSNLNTSIGKEGHNSGSATAKKLTVHEMIVYTHDKMTEQFSIHNNINNYWGVYNDENEWDLDATPAWTSDASSGFIANGTDGFTITTSGNTVQEFKLRIPTDTSPADNDYYKVSFNNNDPDGLIANAQLRVTSGGTGGSATTIRDGFNGIDIINNNNFSFAYFSINAVGGGSSKTATISDFKISRIARDGFVSTWYDQSGHDRHASQDTEAAQPFIVKRGGIVKIGDKPAVHQDNRSSGGNKAGLGVESYNPTQNAGDLTEYSFFAHYKSTGHFGSSTQGQLFSSGGTITSSSYGGLTIGNRDGRRISARHRNNTELSQVLASANTSTDEAYGSIEQNILASFHYKDGVTLTGRDNGVETARPTSSPVSPHARNSANQGRVRLLSSFSFKQIEPFKAPVTEIIFYDKDIRHNAEAIETNMNTYYQIY
jgi:hypothetical protein